MKEISPIYNIASIIAAIAFFMPIALVVIKKLVRDRLIVWYGVYWAWAGFVNMVYAGAFIQNPVLINSLDHVYNLADAPLMLFILYKTTYIEAVKKSIQKILLPFLAFEFVLTAITGLKGHTEGVMVAIGTAVVLSYIIWIILNHMKGVRYSNFQHAMQYIYYALFFEYGVSIITFIYTYILPDKASVEDNFLIFHIATIITITTASYGIIVYKEKVPVQKKKPSKVEREVEFRFL